MCGLASCVAQPGLPSYVGPAVAVPPAPSGRRIAVLVPLSGGSAEIGRSMLRGARLALQAGDGAPFDEKDTKGTPEGAVAAAKSALAAGAGIIVGPLTAGETDAVATVTKPAQVPVLAFTSDSSKAQPGVWPLGITPAQQVRVVVRAAKAEGRSRLGALLPRNPFGNALADGMVSAAQEAALPPPRIIRYDTGHLETAIAELGGPPGAPPGIDALLLGTSADATIAVLPTLVQAGLGPDRVRLMGTAIWAQNAPRLGALAGAWFAAPDPEKMSVFEQNYTARFGTPPRALASIAFDAAAAAKAVTTPTGVSMAVLLNPSGFAGPNGVFVLLPNGHVQRALTLFEIDANGVHARQPGY